MARAKGWTCQRRSAGKVCKHHNPPRSKKCGQCSKPRPARRKPDHMKALDLTYEQYIEINGGEHCGICKRKRKGRRLDRDHDHIRGNARGLLCVRCNRQLATWITIEWLESTIAYLQRNI